MARDMMPKSGALMPYIVVNRDAAVAGVLSVDGNRGAVGLSTTYLKIAEFNNQISPIELGLSKKAEKGDNSDITSLAGLTTPLSPEQGGTGTGSLVDLRENLGLTNAVVRDADTGIITQTDADLQVINGALVGERDGISIALRPHTTDGNSYISARNNDGSQHWLLGKVTAGNQGVSWVSTSGQTISLDANGYINLTPRSNSHQVISNGLFIFNKTGEAARIISPNGTACYIMAYSSNTATVEERRWYIGNGGSDNTAIFYNSSVNSSVALNAGGAVVLAATGSRNFVVNVNGVLTGPLGTIAQSASDVRLKTDIVEAKEGAGTRIDKLGAVEFTMIMTGETQRGWISQQAIEIDPLYAEFNGTATDIDGEEFEILNINDRAILADAVTCIQELREEVKSLKAKLES